MARWAWLRDASRSRSRRCGLRETSRFPGTSACGGTRSAGQQDCFFWGKSVTGLLLCVYYQPTPSSAYDSVSHLMVDVPYGWWIRSLHKWGANLMVVAVSLHLLRVSSPGPTGAHVR